MLWKKTNFSPNIDSLALSSFLYKNAVCNYPVCGASRASVLTGLRPNYKRFTNYKSRADIDAPDVMTIGKWFKKMVTIPLVTEKFFTIKMTLQKVGQNQHGELIKIGGITKLKKY